jgi:hypothetical protein
MEGIGSWTIVYLSSSFSWGLVRIFMSIFRFAYKDNTIYKKRGGKNLILGIKKTIFATINGLKDFKLIILC